MYTERSLDDPLKDPHNDPPHQPTDRYQHEYIEKSDRFLKED